MRKAEFKRIVEEGVTRERLFMVVKLETEGSTGAEIVITPSENFAAKMDYYDRFYNNDMRMIVSGSPNKSISVTDVLMTSNLGDLNWFAY